MAEIPARLRNRLLVFGAVSVALGVYLALTVEVWLGLLVGVLSLSNQVFAWALAKRHRGQK